ncbi:phage terminase family protein [Streptomyces rectiverticillatus]|uniref:phage terminase family protein n=1 Tax=Streptomyces rectiverticillatus TaxID=173860 RepID=UPI001FE6A421|nr:phage terminase family protein [Streptomyces rectiverticillatus]
MYVWETLDRNIRKTANAGSHYVETTNSFNPLENSVAQRTYDAFTSGADGLLYDCVEPDWDVKIDDDEDLARGLKAAYSDSTWVDIPSLVKAIRDPRTTVAVALRFYLNRISESADGWMVRAEWDACFDDSDPIAPGDQISVGFDGSVGGRTGDATGLVGCRLRDGKLFVLGLWERPDTADEAWEVDVLSVEAAVKRAFETYDVAWFYGDPPYWQEALGRWALRYGDNTVFEYWTNRPTRMVAAVERFRTATMVKDLRHDGDSDLTRHVCNAVAREVPQGILIAKSSPRSRKKIDLAICAVLAYEARADAIADGRMTKRRRRVIGF